jgi:hypothetical protein
MGDKKTKTKEKTADTLTMKDVVTAFSEAGIAVDFNMSRNTPMGQIGKNIAKVLEWADSLHSTNPDEWDSMAYALEGLALESIGIARNLRSNAVAARLDAKSRAENG